MNRHFYIRLFAILCWFINFSGIAPAAPSPILAIPSDLILHVKPGGGTTGICDTWEDACELTYALEVVATSGDEIWVSAGTHKPTSGSDRELSFQLLSGVALYGGFSAIEDSLEQRDWEANETILSGNIGDPDEFFDNSYHVVTSRLVDHTAILDGFSIIAGTAYGSFEYPPECGQACGGGIYNVDSSPTLTNLIIHDNRAYSYGGGIYNLHSYPMLNNLTFSENISMYLGGGLYNYDSNPRLENVTFRSNWVRNNGAGMYNEYSSPLLVNVLFMSNNAPATSFTDLPKGGGMYNHSSNPTIINTTFISNTASHGGGGIYNSNSNPIIVNTVLWGNRRFNRITYEYEDNQIDNWSSNPTIQFSDIKGSGGSGADWDVNLGSDGSGNIDDDPLYLQYPHNYELYLHFSSPVIDAGDNSPLPINITTDIGGNPRYFDVASVEDTGSGAPPIVDMGAYEAQIRLIFNPLIMR